jgi:2-polyprenyl-6-methoxyphenol hydroxylase-like FAD-dependent oxidoreductase
MALDDEFLWDLLADFLFLQVRSHIYFDNCCLYFLIYIFQHKDLYDILFNIAVQEGVEFRFNATVIEADPSSVSVVLESGEVLGVDVIVGADGCDSLLRQVVTDSDGTEEGLDDRHVILTWVLPTSKMQADGDLRRLLGIKEVRFDYYLDSPGI